MRLLLVGVASFLVTLAGAVLIERLALRLHLVQQPNERSSHTVPTPRGGGAAMAVAGLATCIYLAVTGEAIMWSIGGLGACIAFLGFGDDLRDLSAGIRFPIQVVLIAVLVGTISPLPPIQLTSSFGLGGSFLAVIAVISGVWWINLFNFMDGIDGIAASQTVLILVLAVLISALESEQFSLGPVTVLMMALVGGAAGFLLRNWSPARIFMGDVGSNFLALMIFACALITTKAGSLTYAIWLILVAVFAADATATLIRRLARGEKPWHAHRSHAYQTLSRRWGHSTVTLLYCGLSAICGGVAALAKLTPDSEWWLVIACYLALMPVAAWVGACYAVDGRPG